MSEINPWVRADVSGFNVETLALIPPAFQEDYGRLMKERQHRLAILAFSLAQVQDAQARVAENENECRLFFDWMQHRDEYGG